jgi:hypothetical protein
MEAERRPRQITTHGWSVEDDLRADRIAQERGVPAPLTFVYDGVDQVPWIAMSTPYMTAGIDIANDGVRVTYFPKDEP